MRKHLTLFLFFLLMVSLPGLPLYAAMQQPLFVTGGSGGSGSNACGTGIDTFDGPANQLLTVHNSAYGILNSAAPVSNFVLDGAGNLGLGGSPWNNASARLTCSTSDSAQVTFVGSATATSSLDKRVCIRTDSSNHYYCATPGYADGSGHWARLNIQKSGSEVVESAIGSWDPKVDHVVKITATGTSTLVINAYIDGVLMATYTDSTPLPVGNPGLIVLGTGNYADTKFDNFDVTGGA